MMIDRGEYRTRLVPSVTSASRVGWPIVTRVIEGTFRHLIADRLNPGGSRWGLGGAEAVLHPRDPHVAATSLHRSSLIWAPWAVTATWASTCPGRRKMRLEHGKDVKGNAHG